MNQETRQCQNCKSQFTIESEDFAFYEKIKVPPPTWCPECRSIRRLVWSNAYVLHKRKCDAPGHSETIISKFAADTDIKVYDLDFWWSDGWSPLDYGRSYDFSKPFFEQFKELLKRVPVKTLDTVNSVNCEYCPSAIECKNGYLLVGCYRSENCLYDDTVFNSRNCVDNFSVGASENCYECVHCNKSYNLKFSIFSNECLNSSFLQWCNNCSDCFGCIGLKSKKYHIFNRPHSKGDYEKEMAKIDMASYQSFVALKNKFNLFSLGFPKKYAALLKSTNCTGHIIENSKNCHNSFGIIGGAENCKYILDGGINLKDSYDVFAGGGNCELLYEDSNTGLGCSRLFFSRSVQQSLDIYYSHNCFNSSHLFGCVGLRNKHYCILNKEYTKEEYEELVPKIMNQMNEMPYVDKKGRVYRFGEFFPFELSPFAYNESIAQDYYPLTKEETISRGFFWRDTEEKNYRISIESDRLPDHIKDVNDAILNEVIGCLHKGECLQKCSKAFRIVPEELAFYRRTGLPLPRLCPNCRYFERLVLRNPLKLWHRKCQCSGVKSDNGVYQNTVTHQHGAGKCPNEFETSYAPDRKEIVYCESCYNAEVV